MAAPGTVRVANLSHEWPPSGGRRAGGRRGRRSTGGGEPALEGVDLEVDAGEFVAVVGPSGCGKSTLLRVLAGLTVPTAGSAEVGGVDVSGRPGACAWMPQNHALLPWRRVLANATLGAEVGGVPSSVAEARARPLLERFGLGGYERAWPAQLSGGMRQRLAVLRTFLVDAPVLLLDEPFGALDALTRRQMQSWLQEVWTSDPTDVPPPSTPAGRTSHPDPTDLPHEAPSEGNRTRRTVLLVTHDVEEAVLLADRVVVMSPRPGRVVADVPVPFARPRSPELVVEPEFQALRASLLEALGA